MGSRSHDFHGQAAHSLKRPEAGRCHTCLFAKTREHSIPELILRQHPHQLLRASFTRSRSLLSTTNINPGRQSMGCTETTDQLPPPPMRNTLHLYPSNICSLFCLPSLGAAAGQELAPDNQEQWPPSAHTQQPFSPWAIHMAYSRCSGSVSQRGRILSWPPIPNCEADVLVLHCLHIEPFQGENRQWSLGPEIPGHKRCPIGLFLFPPGLAKKRK